MLFFQAVIHEAAGEEEKAHEAWKMAAETVDQEFNKEGMFRAIALRKLGESDEAQKWFRSFERANQARRGSGGLDR